MENRDPNSQISTNQARLQNNTNTANNWITGVSSDYRTYTPANSNYASVATSRAGNVDPQRGIGAFYGSGRYTTNAHFFANSSAFADSGNRISYLAPSASRPTNYFWTQNYDYAEPIKAVFSNQYTNGLNFYRLSNGNKVVVDQLKNTDYHWLWYNQYNLDNNLLTISNSGAVSKIESTTNYLDNTTNPTTPLLFQTHGGMGANSGGAMVTDYPRDSVWQANDRDTYIFYRPNFGSNVQIPENVETMGEWISNYAGGRSGS